MFLKWINKCRLCGNPHLEEVIDLGDMPSQGFFIYKDKPPPSSRNIPTKIVRCDTKKWENACGLVQSKVIVPPEILYSNYGYCSSVSKTMTDHLKNLNSKIREIKGNLHGEIVVDIGMNDGTFLKFYDNDVRKIGVDPSDIASKVDGEIKVINECFPTDKLNDFLKTTINCLDGSRRIESKKVSVLTAFACMYDILDIEMALNAINELLMPNGIFVCEVAYLPTVLRDNLYDGLVHEHVSLFSFATLEYALNRTRLKTFKVEKTLTNFGSLLLFVCKKECMKFDSQENLNNLYKLRLEEFNAELDESKTYNLFKDRVNQHGRDLKAKLFDLKKMGKRIHILGASTKLNTILGFLHIGPELIDCASERDIRKHGGSTLNGIPIISEEESRKNVDVYLIGPGHFKDEILKRESEARNRGVQFLFLLPEIELIN